MGRKKGSGTLKPGDNGNLWVRLTVKDGPVDRPWYDLGTADPALAERRIVKLKAKLAAGSSAADAAAAAGAADTVAEYYAAVTPRLAEGDVDNLRRHALDVLGPLALDVVRIGHVKRVRDDAIDAGLARGTVGKVLGAMSRLFAMAIEDELLETNPARDVKQPKQRGDARAATRERVILTDEELGAFVRHEDAPLELRVVSIVARVEGGMRTGDLHHWTWQDIDLDAFAGCVVPRAKTATPQRLEVPPVLRPFLRRWWEAQGKPRTGPVFPVQRGPRAGEQKVTGNSYAKRLRAHLMRAGIVRHVCTRPADAPPVKPDEACCPSMAGDPLFADTPRTLRVDFHSFRRAFNTALAASGVNVQRAMHVAGHSDTKTHMRYVLRTPAMREIPAEAVPSLDGGSRGAIVPEPDDSSSEDDAPAVEIVNDSDGAPGRTRTCDQRLRRAPGEAKSEHSRELAGVKPDDATPSVPVGFDGSREESATIVPAGERSPGDAVEVALAAALTLASGAGEWAVVALLARELEARRLARAASNVVALDVRRRGGRS